MFTGIIGAVGWLRGRDCRGGDASVRVDSGALGLADVRPGDSIAVNGVCLTVTALRGTEFSADVSRETLAHTCLGQMPLGSALNLEKALAVGGRLGGHFVSGHVDGVGAVLRRERLGRAQCLRIRAPAELARYIARKGSIAVDGASLTVNAVDGDCFELAIIPHTMAGTIIAEYAPGRHVHLEVDIMARYLERLLQAGTGAGGDARTGLSPERLAALGYLR